MKISKKEYAEGKINTAAIENCPEYRDWILQSLAILQDKSRLHVLCKDNRESLKKLWGKPHFRYNNGEFYFHAWVCEDRGETYIVLTAKNKGTCVEMVGSCGEVRAKGKAIISFMGNLWEQLKEQK
jgi:hypothetical protein